MDQLKEIHIGAALDAIDLAVYFPRIQRKEYTVGLNLQTSGPDPDPVRRRQMRWTIERKLAMENVRPILYHSCGATCWRRYVKGYTPMVSRVFSGHRFEDLWLDK